MDNWNVKSAEICFNINEAIYHKIQKHFEDAYLYYYQVYHLVHIYKHLINTVYNENFFVTLSDDSLESYIIQTSSLYFQKSKDKI